MTSRWTDTLPAPVAFVLSGGATLGALQVGMLHALAEAGLTPDLVVGTSAGALNGAILAATGDTGTAAARLDATWRRLRREDVFPGSLVHQAWRLVRKCSVFPNDGLRRLLDRTLDERRFAELALPFGVLATDTLTGHPHLFTAGNLAPPLLASAAIPALFPEVDIDGVPYWDGGVSANVPLRAAVRMGAASLVVLDVGDICHRQAPPEGVAATIAAAFGLATRQRVLVEAPVVAETHPVLYLPRPCVDAHDPLDFGDTDAFITTARATADEFLAETAAPRPGAMAGGPHSHVGSPLTETIPVETAGA